MPLSVPKTSVFRNISVSGSGSCFDVRNALDKLSTSVHWTGIIVGNRSSIPAQVVKITAQYKAGIFMNERTDCVLRVATKTKARFILSNIARIYK
jgi:hypothetical protein